jgi:membrane associated rhomboid family serine protease
VAEDFKMTERRFKPVAATRKAALATSTSILKGCGSVALLVLFLLAAATNASATTTLTPATVTFSPASPTYGATVTLTAILSGWVSAAAGTVTFTTSLPQAELTLR